MPPVLTLMIGLMVFLDQRTWAQSGFLPQPSIWAEPGAVIPQGSSVTIFCRIPAGVPELCLFKSKKKVECYDQTTLGAQEEATFSLLNVTHISAATYQCLYWKKDVMYGQSDWLDLVVTDVYEHQPSLTAQAGPQVASGENVTLLCQSPHSYDTFILCSVGGASVPQGCSRQDHGTFLIPLVNLTDRVTYRCYGAAKQSPSLWSVPSDPLELSVTGPPEDTVTGVSAVAVCLPVLFLLLILILFCLWQHWAKLRLTYGGSKRQVKDKSSSLAVDNKDENKREVTDVQLHPDTLRGRVVPPHNNGPLDSPLVYSSIKKRARYGSNDGSVDVISLEVGSSPANVLNPSHQV